MARIWQEGFEDALPYNGYIEGNPNSQYIYNSSFSSAPNKFNTASGRNSYSNKSLYISPAGNSLYYTKVLTSDLTQLYFRAYLKIESLGASPNEEMIWLKTSGGTKVISLFQDNTTGTYSIRTTESGSYASRHTFTLSINTWYKIDIYLNINSSTGEYTVKLDDMTIKSDSSLDLGSSGINNISFGAIRATCYTPFYLDDIALNDTTGSINNSWCGNGTIVSLKPKSSGTTTQWDTCEGYAKAENGTTTTNIEITGHGLATNDVIYNKTRNAYRIVTVVDANNLTVSSITSQAENDIILMYNVQATISAAAGTSTNVVVISGHNMQSGDVIVNTTRSNAIRQVIYVNGNNVYNYYDVDINPPNTLGSTVTSQASGDSIKTFKFKPYAITNHWEAVANNTDPSPKLSYIRSTTLNDIDTYDMQELTADLGIPSGASIVAVSHNIYAQEAGAGSEIKPVFRISSTDYAGDTQTLSSGTLQYQKIYETSPATSTAWSRSEIDGLEAGVKLV